MNPQDLSNLWAATLPSINLQTGDPGASYRPATGLHNSLARSRRSHSGPQAGPPYQVTAELGRGGMGVVYSALQSSLEREVALKTVIDRQRDQGPFLDEARVTAALNHPNIVPVHDLVPSADGAFSLVMKRVRGREWKALLHPEGQAPELGLDGHLEIFLKVCDAVAFAHSRGIAHCDLKPENVMVGDFGEVLVMDWGIALDIRDPQNPVPAGELIAPHRSSITGPRGTPCYMAPELAEGQGSLVGPWTDVYLLGAILTEILTGQPPHRGDSLLRVILAATESAPPEFPPGAPEELAAIARRAMAREPRERFASVEALQQAIKEFQRHRESIAVADAALAVLEGCQKSARALERGQTLSEPERIRLYGDYAEAVAALTQARLLWAENRRAIAGEHRARAAYARAALTGGDLGLAEAQIARLEKGSEDKAALRGELAQARARVQSSARRTFLLKSLVAVLLTAVFVGLSLGLYFINEERLKTEEQKRRVEAQRLETEKQKERAEANAQKARDRVKELREAFDLLIVEVQDRLGRVPYTEVRLARQELLVKALSSLEAIERSMKEDGAFAGASSEGFYQLSLLAEATGDLKKARDYAEQALAISRRARSEKPQDPEALKGLIRALHNLGDDAFFRSEVERAYRYYRESITLARQLLDRAPSELEIQRQLSSTLIRMTVIHDSRGEDSEARACLKEGLALARALHERQPDNLRYHRDLAVYLTQRSIFETKDGALDQALKTREEVVGHLRELRARHPYDARVTKHFGDALIELAQYLQDRERRGEALARFKEALELRRELAQKDPLNIQSVTELGVALRCCADLSGPDEARRCYQEAAAASRRLWRGGQGGVEAGALLSGHLAGLAEFERARDQTAAARAAMAEAAEVLRSVVKAAPNNVSQRRDLSIALQTLVQLDLQARRPQDLRALMTELVANHRVLVKQAPQYKEELETFEKALASMGS